MQILPFLAQLAFCLFPLEHFRTYPVTVIFPAFYLGHAESLPVSRIIFIYCRRLFYSQRFSLNLAAFRTRRDGADFFAGALIFNFGLTLTLRAKNLFAPVFCAVFVKSPPGSTLGANKEEKHLIISVPVVQIFLLTNHVGKTGDAANPARRSGLVQLSVPLAVLFTPERNGIEFVPVTLSAQEIQRNFDKHCLPDMFRWRSNSSFSESFSHVAAFLNGLPVIQVTVINFFPQICGAIHKTPFAWQQNAPIHLTRAAKLISLFGVSGFPACERTSDVRELSR
ncbi:MAG TPA: hypothetical protein VJT54_18625 [Verrucomicrobiae bacterium]|nr:hypothetical protein [Verrucomicrobiae bacterium]